ncbi:uncharacterized protein LOC100381404 [Zea mays]|uniref:Uncharacterized protein n=1 Tax=Zea mays TaxID=4577 RepID=C0HFS7_MAIZE|nr:uncharacterized protein LOC100381404 [Zea mays]ACN25880.1 unknown [Zea mays]|eukprot:NP_001167716.1 uncharacterized protein LOC100381404 [Zea mays]
MSDRRRPENQTRTGGSVRTLDAGAPPRTRSPIFASSAPFLLIPSLLRFVVTAKVRQRWLQHVISSYFCSVSCSCRSMRILISRYLMGNFDL